MERLKGKRALITGGTTGIGFETARLFMEEGAQVLITSSTQESIEQAKRGLGGDLLAVVSDAGDVPGQRTLAASIQESFGSVDVVVLNAGIVDMRPLDQWDEAAYDRSFAINLKGPFFLMQALLPLFAKPASVIVTASINASIGMPNSSVYSATKAGLRSFARTLSGELVSKGIRVNAISPGPIATAVYSGLGAIADSIKAQVPAGRFGDPREIAQAMLFLASNEAAFTVGSELVIDGGMSTL